jgi:hypothetical protein
MEHELKIVIKLQDGQPLTANKIVVYLDELPLGVIQDIKFRAGVDDVLPALELTFPNLESDSIAPSYKTSTNFISMVREQVDKLSNFPGIKVFLKELF